MGRARLRALLGALLGIAPERVPLRSSAFGKPEVSSAGIHFNLSHARDVMLVAVSTDRPVGVDLEIPGPNEDPSPVVRAFFTARERDAWAALPPEEKLPSFYRAWTVKEAFLKARGGGLSGRVDSVEIDMTGGAALSCPGMHGWSFQGWEPAPGAFAALAAEGRWTRADRGQFT
jgi:4'-phosphopantetheinyl transferase